MFLIGSKRTGLTVVVTGLMTGVSLLVNIVVFQSGMLRC